MNPIVKTIRHIVATIGNELSRVYNDLTIAVFGHRQFKRFIVLARARTGSNMLMSILDSHPNIRAGKREIFCRLEGRHYKDLLAKSFRKSPRHIKARGFKIFYYHPSDGPCDDLWNDLVKMEDLYIIHLKRRNILRSVVSQEIAKKSGHWERQSGQETDLKDKAVTLTTEDLDAHFHRTREFEERGDEMFKDHPMITVYYEDLADNPDGAFDEIMDFLGLPHGQPQTNLVKQNPESLKDLITNYDELESAFQETRWQSFFRQ